MRLLILLLLSFSQLALASVIDFQYHRQNINIKSYKELRDADIVKQDLDYSCGAAAIATLLNNYFYQNITEEQLLAIINKDRVKASFLDMQNAINTLGFTSQGLAVSYDTLKTLKSPAIVHIKHRKTDHFSVLRGINEHFVWLADPSLGNQILSRAEFIKLWHTRDDKVLSGKILVIIPNSTQKINPNYFTHTIKQPNKQSLSMIGYRQ